MNKISDKIIGTCAHNAQIAPTRIFHRQTSDTIATISHDKDIKSK